MAALGGQSTPALEGQKFALTGTIASTPDAIRMDDLDILLGDNAATGSFEATTGDPMAFKVKLAMGRLDADALMAAYGRPAKAYYEWYVGNGRGLRLRAEKRGGAWELTVLSALDGTTGERSRE